MKPIIYISGKITGDENYKEKFEAAEKLLIEKGFNVINPCKIGEADTLFMLSDWKKLKKCYQRMALCTVQRKGNNLSVRIERD